MNKPTTQEIRERHDAYEQDDWLIHQDRGILLTRIEKLEARLELDEHGHDGIYCRDETIRLLQKQLAEIAEECSNTTTIHGEQLVNADCILAIINREEADE